MTELCPLNVHTQKWHLAYFLPIDYIQTNFEVNQTKIGNFVPIITEMAISKNYILLKCHSSTGGVCTPTGVQTQVGGGGGGNFYKNV